MRATTAALFATVLLAGCPSPDEPTKEPEDVGRPIPSDPVDHAAQLLEQGKVAEAEQVITAALDKDPENHELIYSHGVVLQAAGKPAEAIARWRRALELEADYFPALNGIGAAELEAGNHEAAVEALSAALRLKPDFASAHYNLALALLAMNREADATKALENAHRLAPQDPDVMVELALAYARQGKDDEALALAKQAAALAPGSVAARATYGQLLFRAKDYAGAGREFEAALAKDPADVQARLGLSRTKMRLGKTAAAVADLRALAKAQPDSAVVHSDLGAALAKSGKLDEALVALDRAVTLDGALLSARLRKTGVLADLGRCKAAKAALREVKKLKPRDAALEAAKAAVKACR